MTNTQTAFAPMRAALRRGRAMVSMTEPGMHLPHALGLALLLGVVLAPSVGWACACGCGVFDVGTSSMFPEGQGGMVFLEYDYQDQNQNWHGTSSAPAANNDDKEIRTHFVTLGLQYMFDRS